MRIFHSCQSWWENRILVDNTTPGWQTPTWPGDQDPHAQLGQDDLASLWWRSCLELIARVWAWGKRGQAQVESPPVHFKTVEDAKVRRMRSHAYLKKTDAPETWQLRATCVLNQKGKERYCWESLKFQWGLWIGWWSRISSSFLVGRVVQWDLRKWPGFEQVPTVVFWVVEHHVRKRWWIRIAGRRKGKRHEKGKVQNIN